MDNRQVEFLKEAFEAAYKLKANKTIHYYKINQVDDRYVQIAFYYEESTHKDADRASIVLHIRKAMPEAAMVSTYGFDGVLNPDYYVLSFKVKSQRICRLVTVFMSEQIELLNNKTEEK